MDHPTDPEVNQPQPCDKEHIVDMLPQNIMNAALAAVLVDKLGGDVEIPLDTVDGRPLGTAGALICRKGKLYLRLLGAAAPTLDEQRAQLDALLNKAVSN